MRQVDGQRILRQEPRDPERKQISQMGIGEV